MALKPAVRRLLAGIVAADGSIDEAELAKACTVFESVVGQPIPPDELRTAAEAFLAAGVSLDRSLAPLVIGLNAAGRRAVFTAACAVAKADGSVAPEENALLRTVATVLHLSPAEVAAALRD